MSKRLLLAATLVAVLTAAGLGTYFVSDGRAREGKRATKGPAAVPVNVAAAQQQTVPVVITGIGNVEAFSTVSIKARVDGQIVEVKFREGQPVTKGEVLFRIDPRPYQAALRQAEANALRDKAARDQALSQAKRYQELLDKNFISKEAYAQIRTNAETAAAQVSADNAAIRSAQLSLDYCTIRSPITGYAGKIQIQEGNLVKANDTSPLVVLNQVVPINASFSVPEQSLADVRKYRADGELQVTAQVPNSGLAPVPGTLSFIDNATDATTGTIKLKAEFPNVDKALWPGQFVDVVLTLTLQDNAVVVPPVAVQNGPNGQYVFVVKPDHTVEVRDIKVLRNEGDSSVVASGVKPGETVVTVGQLRLAPGAKVTIADAKAAQ
jgi:membrane fusion protein, multidrug efflux system